MESLIFDNRQMIYWREKQVISEVGVTKSRDIFVTVFKMFLIYINIYF